MGKVTRKVARSPHQRQWPTGEETDEERRNRLHIFYWWKVSCGLDRLADEYAAQWFVEPRGAPRSALPSSTRVG